MRFTRFLLIVVGMAAFVLAACSPKTVSTPAPVSQGPALTREGKEPLKQGWEADWQRTLQEARKEGTVSVYATLLGPPLREQASAFKQKFGIDLEITTGRGSDMAQKFIRERAAGIYIADTVISGLNTFFGAVKKSGSIVPMQSIPILPEIVDPKLWYLGNTLPWADDDKTIFSFFAYPNRDIHINADFVKPGDIQSWLDLLDPRWKGKIIWSDPSVTGSGFNGFSTLVYHKILDLDYYRQMASKQDIMVTRDLRLQVDWLARGRAYIAISAEGTPVAEYIRAGANLDVIAPKEGTYLSVDAGNIAIAKNAPHPNATKIFVNWLLSKEGQTFAQTALKYPSARVDLTVEGVNPKNVRVAGEKYYAGANSIEKWVLEEQDKYIEYAREIFGPLVGR